MGKKQNTDQNEQKDPKPTAQNLWAPASQPTMGLSKQLAGLRLDAIPSHRDRGSTPFGDQRHHPSTREVTSRPTAWSREVVEEASH
jgi:hypothetical protein